MGDQIKSVDFFDSNSIVGRLDEQPYNSYSLEPEHLIDQMN